jgi:hypothetical protein
MMMANELRGIVHQGHGRHAVRLRVAQRH